MSQLAGVHPMPIAGRVARQRERCLGMTDAERAWRKQWLKDQILAPNEPVYVHEAYLERNNPIKRMIRMPLDTIFTKLAPTLGEARAANYRFIVGKLGLIALGILSTHYYFKYNQNDWTRKGGWRVIRSKPMVLPGQPGFPFVSNRKPNEYATRGFENSPLTAGK